MYSVSFNGSFNKVLQQEQMGIKRFCDDSKQNIVAQYYDSNFLTMPPSTEPQDEVVPEEDIMSQLLPPEDVDAIATAANRALSEPEEPVPAPKKVKNSVSEEPTFSVSQVALNDMVEGVQRLKDQTAKSRHLNGRLEKALVDNTWILRKNGRCIDKA